MPEPQQVPTKPVGKLTPIQAAPTGVPTAPVGKLTPIQTPGSFEERAAPTQGGPPVPKAPVGKLTPIEPQSTPPPIGPDAIRGAENLDQQPYPEWFERGLETVNKYAVQPFEKMAQGGGEIGSQQAMKGLGLDPVSLMAAPFMQQQMSAGPLRGVASELGRFTGSIASDPRQLLLMGGGLGEDIAAKLASLFFRGQMGYDAYERAGQLGSQWDTAHGGTGLTPEEKAAGITGMTANAAMAGHGLSDEFKFNAPRISDTGRGVGTQPAQVSAAPREAPAADPQLARVQELARRNMAVEGPGKPTVTAGSQMGAGRVGEAKSSMGTGLAEQQERRVSQQSFEEERRGGSLIKSPEEVQREAAADLAAQPPQQKPLVQPKISDEALAKERQVALDKIARGEVAPDRRAAEVPQAPVGKLTPIEKPQAAPTQPFELPKRQPDTTKAFPDRKIGEQPKDFAELIKSQVERGQISREEASKLLAKHFKQEPTGPGFRYSSLSPEEQGILSKEPPSARPTAAEEAKPTAAPQPAPKPVPGPEAAVGTAGEPLSESKGVTAPETPSKTPIAEPQKPVEPRSASTWLADQAKADPRVMSVVVKALKASHDLPEASRATAAKAAMAEIEKHLRDGKNPVYAGEQALKKIASKSGEAGFATLGGKSAKGLRQKVEALPKNDIDQRLKDAKEEAKKASKGQHPVATAFNAVHATGTAIKDWYLHPEKGMKLSEALGNGAKSEDYKRALGKYSRAKQESQNNSNQLSKELKSYLPTEEIREAITNHIQAAGDNAVLATRASASNQKHRVGYELAQKLKPNEKAVVDIVKEYYDNRLKEGQQLGILEHGLDNYINQVWKKDSAFKRGLQSELQAGKFNTSFNYAKKRFYESFFEGEQAGKTPATKDVADLITHYENTMNEAILARKFAKDLWDGKAEDFRPLLVPEWKSAKVMRKEDLGPNPEAYAIPLHGPGKGRLIDAEIAKLLGIPVNEKTLTETDKVRTETGDYSRIDHPAFRKYVFSMEGKEGPVFVQSDALAHPSIAGHLKNLYTKSWFRDFGPTRVYLKGQNFMKQVLLGAPGFHYVQEGYHAAFHKINPFDRDIISGKRLQDAMENATVQHGMERGLLLVDHNAVARAGEGISGLGAVSTYIRAMQEHLFNTYIPGLKATLYERSFKDNLKRYASDLASGKITKDQLAEITAAHSNAAFGELNYDWMGRNKTAQDLFRMAALAPDFLEARGRFAAQATRPYGREQLAALVLRAGIYQWTAARILNAALNNGNTYIDDPDMLFKVKAGKRTYGARSIAGDILHLARDPWGFMTYRAAPGLRIALQASARVFKGKDMTWEDVMQAVAPIPVQGAISDLIHKHTPTSKYADSLMESFGIQSTKYYTPEQRKQMEKREDIRQRKLHGERIPTRPKGLSLPRP